MDQRLRVLFQQGVLDEEQFTQLLQLQDESSPNFISRVASLYFHDTEKLLRDLRELVDSEELDYEKIEFHLIKLKGTSAMIGAKRIRDECVTFKNICQQNGTQAGCLRSLEILEEEFSYLESKLSQVFQIERLLMGPSANRDPMLPPPPPPPPNNPSA